MSFHSEEPNERRNKKRFPLVQELRYAILHNGQPFAAGFGLTSDMSSTGIAFRADGLLPSGYMVEIAMNWPVPLDHGCPLQLMVLGRIIRSQGSSVACTIDRSEFRTRSKVCSEAVRPAEPLWSDGPGTRGLFARYRASASSR